MSHLIGEPIPGNCFMWSAPLQPFVLPVRVRSFEALYKNEVKTGSGAALAGIRAQQILGRMSGSLDRLKSDFIQALKQPSVKWFRLHASLPDGTDGIGVGSGQLYYVIKDIKQESDTQSEDQLKKELLRLLLGEGAFHLVKAPNGKEYFWASLEAWTSALGLQPRVSDLS